MSIVTCIYVVIGVDLTTGNMVAGMLGVTIIASPINAGAIAMVLSLVVTPLVGLVTKPVEFEIEPRPRRARSTASSLRRPRTRRCPLRQSPRWGRNGSKSESRYPINPCVKGACALLLTHGRSKC